MSESIRRALESGIAELLRRHAVDVLFARPDVVAALGQERVAALRAEVLERLRRSEEEGRVEKAELLARFSELLTLIAQTTRGPDGRTD